MQSHKGLNVWKNSIDLAVEIYDTTRTFPREELFGITSQLRRAVTSISMNIAEGYGRGTSKEVIHFLYIASGSAAEVDTQLVLCQRLGYIDCIAYEQLLVKITAIRKMLSSLIKSVKAQQPNV